ncbi:MULTISPECIES: response regulator transcription factor [Comamonadaceae]|jgi:two-component system invasion response regulator UvrY|uniref:response regulator n=1 Tax=Comamonadaceae TaxID=80864 RepID=UPI000BD5DA83|nr:MULTISPECIES: response regulator transcription factor [Comamonadaceae]OZA57500.1 MAG: DNA-binding response regulator [Acidovorax sp. 17-64-282]HQT19448.1 response regulator transcription factor [Acidovorax defluvii]OYY25904.1 MAG: DNA-binding response regulator [Acidovorax sp. 35-64-16]OYY85130.1 MAG: DNA-binding response regulator [Acidovorax sp. 28-64-14]OZA67269.1 MAG: DNA-binding response regulator [Acidovorax sp. 39-64-12]
MSNSLHGIRVLLADDHAMVRLGFRMLLESAGGCVIGETENGESALRLYAETTPDILIMDVSMPGIGGLTALERLISWAPKARVLMLSAHHDDAVPVRALRLGARGYLCKRATPEEFLRAVGQVARNQRYLDPELAQAVALAQLSGATSPLETLTEKEFAVFMQLAQGRTVNDVAADFFLSPSTVGTHLYHIKQKLNLQNAAEMALLAMRSGLIEA